MAIKFLNVGIVYISIVFLCSNASAANTGYAFISEIKTDSSGALLTTTADESWVDTVGCGATPTGSTRKVFIDASRPEFDNIYAMLILAVSINWKVAFWYNDCTNSKLWGGPFVRGKLIYIRDPASL